MPMTLMCEDGVMTGVCLDRVVRHGVKGCSYALQRRGESIHVRFANDNSLPKWTSFSPLLSQQTPLPSD